MSTDLKSVFGLVVECVPINYVCMLL